MRSISKIFQRQARSLERVFVLWVNPYVLFVLYRIWSIILPMLLVDMRFTRLLLCVIAMNWICEVDEILSDTWSIDVYELNTCMSYQKNHIVLYYCLQVLHLNSYDVKEMVWPMCSSICNSIGNIGIWESRWN